MNGAGHTLGSIARSGASAGGSTVGAKTRVNNELAKARGFLEGDRRGFVKKVLDRWIRGRIWEPSLRIRLRL